MNPLARGRNLLGPAPKHRSFIASTGLHVVDGYTGLDGLDLHELPKLVAAAQRRFYLRPRQILRMLRAGTPAMFAGYLKGFAALVSKELRLRRRPAAVPVGAQ